MRRGFFGWALLIASALLDARVARAQLAIRSSSDVITLKDGTSLRGTITEIASGDHVLLLLSDSQTARVRWDAIAKAERDGTPIDLAALRAPTTANPTTPVIAEKPVPKVTVHVESTRPVELQLNEETSLDWKVVCASPCDVELPIGRLYRIDAPGVRRSKPFTLRGVPGGTQLLDVDAGSSAGHTVGMVFTSIGSPIVLIGGIVVAVHLGNGNTDSVQGSAIATGVGLAFFVPGLYLTISNDGTTVVQSRGGRTAAAERDPELAVGARTRLPTWRSADGPTMPAAPTISLFRGTF